ncbi:hypothetical protein [Streptomyces sp. NBC_00654]|uniref:hypothetical protein n=1 Tax=Streptomyces sp. NBC_00654 TaxID=2975799 RepID=UPI002B1DD622|nr:hypothetical protein [Streptomyces sp. NBC_00654]
MADPRALVVTAAGTAAAGFAINHHLVEEDTDRAVADRRTATDPATSLPSSR